jgi:hypothetical protein
MQGIALIALCRGKFPPYRRARGLGYAPQVQIVVTANDLTPSATTV